MTLRHLEIFLKVAESGSMRAASEQLFITQPTVSGAVAELEKECNVLLFERLNKRLYITEAGKKMCGYARRMLSLRDDIERQIGFAEDKTPIRIGATVTIGTCLLPQYINEFSGTSPRVRIDNTPMIEQLILNNSLDVGLVEGHISSEDIVSIPFYSDEMMLVCRKDCFLGKRKKVKLAEVAENPLILREKDSGTRTVIDEAFKKMGLKGDVLWDCNNTQAILNAVESGIGVSVLSPSLIKDYRNLTAVPISDVDIKRDFLIIVHKDKYISNKLEELIDIIREREIV